MKKFIDLISEEMMDAFDKAGYERELGRVVASNRPDLCEYQCNGAMAGAKRHKVPPMEIAKAVAEQLLGSAVFSRAEAVMPGFLNLDVSGSYLMDYVNHMFGEEKYGVEAPAHPQTFVLDYGGANVAKPLHVGHLRPAVIGESIKRILRYAGHKVIGDVHLGDWGMPMGQVITELQTRHPELVYFDEGYTGDYPEEPPFTISDLEEIYPAASARCKEDAAYKERALRATHELQQGRRGYRALWRHILDVSVADLKVNYGKLGVDFDLWMGESDVDALIPGMVEAMKSGGWAYLSDGALVVDIGEETDKKELPPCIVLKRDGSANYETTDLATILYREREIRPDVILYITDKRQELHFTQVFRAAKKCGIAKPETVLEFVGNGTINGADGKPFKTRDGGVPRLEYLLREIELYMLYRLQHEQTVEGDGESAAEAVSRLEEAARDGAACVIPPIEELLGSEEEKRIARTVGLAALKYGDLSNQIAKDYIYDMEKFTASEGDTGPYLLYTMARIKSVLRKYLAERGEGADEGRVEDAPALRGLRMEALDEAAGPLLRDAAGFSAMVEEAARDRAPHKVCAYAYRLANDFNSFYHSTKILGEADAQRRRSYIALLSGVLHLFGACTQMLGFEAPERM